MTTNDKPQDCECENCGVIFIGADWMSLCPMCAPTPAPAAPQQRDDLVALQEAASRIDADGQRIAELEASRNNFMHLYLDTKEQLDAAESRLAAATKDAERYRALRAAFCRDNDMAEVTFDTMTDAEFMEKK